jgi:hypothetical protein
MAFAPDQGAALSASHICITATAVTLRMQLLHN